TVDSREAMAGGWRYRQAFQSHVRGLMWVLVALWNLSGAGVADAQTASPSAAAALSPEATVTRYLEALKAGNFAAAYDVISKDMAQGKSRADWAKEQQ